MEDVDDKYLFGGDIVLLDDAADRVEHDGYVEVTRIREECKYSQRIFFRMTSWSYEINVEAFNGQCGFIESSTIGNHAYSIAMDVRGLTAGDRNQVRSMAQSLDPVGT